MNEECTFEEQQEACRLIHAAGGEVENLGRGIFKVTLPLNMKVYKGDRNQACEFLFAPKLVARARELYGKYEQKAKRKPRSDKGTKKVARKTKSSKPAKKQGRSAKKRK